MKKKEMRGMESEESPRVFGHSPFFFSWHSVLLLSQEKLKHSLGCVIVACACAGTQCACM